MIKNGVLKPDDGIKMRGGTAEALSVKNPLPARREIIVETDTKKLKVGDGVHKYNELPYAGGDVQSPPSDNNVYVMRNGAWEGVRLVTQPVEWSPEIDDVEEIVLTLDSDMVPYQLTGRNVT